MPDPDTRSSQVDSSDDRDVAASRNEAAAFPQSERVVDDGSVRARAYEIYLERGGAPGEELEDWLRAEREVGGRSADRSNDVGESPANA